MTGCVYFIGPQDWRHNRVKIGFTKGKPKQRLASMQTGSPFLLSVYGFCEGDMALEKLLHETFAPLRENGEWFRLEGRLLALVSYLYFETYGDSQMGRHAMDSVLVSALLDKDPPETYCPIEWRESANVERIKRWLERRQRYMRAAPSQQTGATQ